jgi:hypothetical protein
MSSFEVNTQVFVIRIWREPSETKDSQPQWRAMIEHVSSQQRAYTDDLDKIMEIVKSYLDQADLTST